MFDHHTPFKLFASCVLVKGVSRSTICDLNRNFAHLIPNSLYQLLLESQGQTFQAVKTFHDIEHHETIEEYFNFLYDNELIFFDKNLELFPQLDMQWYSPTQINAAIIDVNTGSSYSVDKLAKELDQLGCPLLEIRVYSPFPIDRFFEMLVSFKYTTVTSIIIIAPYSELVSEQTWINFCNQHPVVCQLVVHTAPEEKNLKSDQTGILVNFVTKVISNETCCGVINSDYFTSYIETFAESLQFNSCLNRKISIDTEGNIKNCPSMKESFGNIKDTTLKEAINKPGFMKYWNITKDQISVCKDCEFRHVCTDCRAYLEEPEDDYSKPLKCGYDPYTCQWEEWSTHPMKQAAIDHYEMRKRM